MNTVSCLLAFLGTAAGSAFVVLWRFGGWHAVTLGCLVLSALAFSGVLYLNQT
jgi:hypothetical protein